MLLTSKLLSVRQACDPSFQRKKTRKIIGDLVQACPPCILL